MRRHPGLVVVLLVPVVVFAAPQLTGSTFLDGDNFLQNFPMRAQVGLDLRHHTLPLWNPYLFSGTPLLGGFNAGAAYPTTWLMAVLPIFTAWTLNLAIAYDVAIVGMYAFLRRQAISSTAATFGAAAFAFSGYMTAQLVHIDLIAAAAWLPWMLVAVHAVTDGRPDRSPTAIPGLRRRPTRFWIGLLALAVGMSILTGGTEAIIDSGILAAVFLIGRLVTMGYIQRSRLTALATAVGALAVGAAPGVALGAAQLVPGLAFQSQSQRAATTYTFFSTGSLPARLLTLVAAPFLLGTGRGQPGYAGPYNFQEVTSFVGVLALIAACSLVVRRWRRRPEARHWWVWYVVLALGALSALGAQTPFGHVLFLFPVIRSERLLNRNLLLVDFSLVVLFAWWVHLLLQDRADGATTDSGVGDPPMPLGHRWQPGRRAELIATCAPAAVIVVLCLFLWIDGPLLERLLQTQFPIDRTARWQDAGLVTLGALIAVGATWLVLAERRFSRARLRQLLALVLVADLILFNGFVIHPPITQSLARGQGSLAPSLTAAVGDGRFIIYNPDQFYDNDLYELAQTDLNIFNRLGSGQGYTALTDASYVNATGAHYQEDLNPATLAGTTWDQLNVRTLLTLPSYFVTPITTAGPSGGTAPAPATSTPFPLDLNLYNSAPTPEPPPVTLRPGQSHRWYFGGLLTVATWAVRVPGGTPSGWRVGVLTATGAIQWLPPADVTATGSAANRSLRVAPPTPVRGAGLVIQNEAGAAATVGVPTAHTAEAGDVVLRGRMQYGVTWPHWRFSGTIGSFGVFQNADPLGWAWAGAAGGAAASGTSVTTAAPGSDGNQQIAVHAVAATTLERSVAWSPGWRATIRRTGPAMPGSTSASATSTVAVQRDGVIQRVAIPTAGDYLVSFSYAPASVTAGLIVSAVAAVAFLIWAGWELVIARRRRRRLNPE
ncbi:MAG: hypothetical protein IVW52_10855 [Acidimicrobiales bacterium]|nr:hypothetical protein [Acidimicrobiales bacterium]